AAADVVSRRLGEAAGRAPPRPPGERAVPHRPHPDRLGGPPPARRGAGPRARRRPRRRRRRPRTRRPPRRRRPARAAARRRVTAPLLRPVARGDRPRPGRPGRHRPQPAVARLRAPAPPAGAPAGGLARPAPEDLRRLEDLLDAAGRAAQPTALGWQTLPARLALTPQQRRTGPRRWATLPVGVAAAAVLAL